MLNVDPLSLGLFVSVCEAGSISRVAERENMVVSAISKRLAQLELRLGARLLDRTRSGVTPTPTGLVLLDHARAVLALIDDIERDVVSTNRLARGLVRVFVAAASLAEDLPDDVAAFLSLPAHADIRVSIEEELSHAVIEGVRRGAATIGICWDVVDTGNVHAATYRFDHLGIVCAASHALAGREEVSFAETLDYPHIGLPAASNFQTTLREAANLSNRPLRYRATMTTFEAAARVAHSGLGVAIVPREVAERIIGVQGCFVPLSDTWARRRFIVCCREYEQLSVAARLLFDHLASRSS